MPNQNLLPDDNAIALFKEKISKEDSSLLALEIKAAILEETDKLSDIDFNKLKTLLLQGVNE